MKRLRFTVSKQRIKDNLKNFSSCFLCPIADAIREQHTDIVPHILDYHYVRYFTSLAEDGCWYFQSKDGILYKLGQISNKWHDYMVNHVLEPLLLDHIGEIDYSIYEDFLGKNHWALKGFSCELIEIGKLNA